jgi:hypothetical protein
VIARADLYGGTPPEQVAAYSVREVADYLLLPKATVRAWVLGTTYLGANGTTRTFRPVIRIADEKQKRLSFENLVEVHVLSSLRRKHRVRLDEVRRAIDYLRREYGAEHPLAREEMLTDGVNVFVDKYGRLTNVSQEGQQAMRDLVRNTSPASSEPRTAHPSASFR